jgi:hypothetical protein
VSESYLGEIRMFAGTFAPLGWMFCRGQILSIAENTALYQLISTTYGGDGQTTFALPDLRGRVPIHRSSNFNVGQPGGVENVTLTTQQLPAHTHIDGLGERGCDQYPAEQRVGCNSSEERHCLRVRLRHPHYRSQFGLDRSDGRHRAARQLSAVSVRQLHHLSGRGLSKPALRRNRGRPVSC